MKNIFQIVDFISSCRLLPSSMAHLLMSSKNGEKINQRNARSHLLSVEQYSPADLQYSPEYHCPCAEGLQTKQVVHSAHRAMPLMLSFVCSWWLRLEYSESGVLSNPSKSSAVVVRILHKDVSIQD